MRSDCALLKINSESLPAFGVFLPLCYKNMFYNIKMKVFAFVAKFFLLFSRKSFEKSFVNKKLYIILLRNET